LVSLPQLSLSLRCCSSQKITGIILKEKFTVTCTSFSIFSRFTLNGKSRHSGTN
jgi:hypothetical protein